MDDRAVAKHVGGRAGSDMEYAFHRSIVPFRTAPLFPPRAVYRGSSTAQFDDPDWLYQRDAPPWLKAT